MKIRQWTTALLSLLALMLVVPLSAGAEASVTITSEAGFQNKVKYGEGAPLTFTFVNDGPAFSGDLVVDYAETYNLGGGVSVPVELAEGETKTIQFATTGVSEDMMYGMGSQTPQSIFLYEGGWEEGKSVEFNGPKTLRPAFFGPTDLFIGTLTSNPDRLLPLDGTSSAGVMQFFHLNQLDSFTFSADPLTYDSLDYLIIDDVPFSDLPENVQTALLQWVQQGGQIIMSASRNIEAESGQLSPYMPLELTEPRQLAVPGFENEVSGYGASLREEAKEITAADGQPIAARMDIGSGALIQTAFPIGSGTVTGDAGYVAFMNTLFEVDQSAYAGMVEPIMDRLPYEVAETNELFESFAVSGTLITILVLLYILLVVPFLYLYLKKKDRREHAWILIPSIAVVMSVVLFVTGAKDRLGQAQVQQTGFFEVDVNGGLSGYFVNSLLSNKGGSYRFEAPSSTKMARYLHDPYSVDSLHQQAITETGSSQTELTIRDMRYWSVASIIGQSYVDQAGSFGIELVTQNRHVKGSVTNNFSFAVEDAAIWTGTRLLPIGNLSPGESIAIDETLQSDFLTPAAEIGYMQGYQPIGSGAEELMEAKKQNLLTMSYTQLIDNEPSPYIVGYTRDAIVPVTLADQRADMAAVHLIAQPFRSKIELEGDITIDPTMFSLEISSSNGFGHFDRISEDPYLYYMEDGEYEINYTPAPEVFEHNISVASLKISNVGNSTITEILNHETGKYEPVPPGNTELQDNPHHYLSKQGAVTLKIRINTKNSAPEILLPKVSLEGAVAQ